MSRLIDADKLKAHYAWWKGGTREMTMDEAKSDFDCIIDLQPTIDAEPVKHGRWLITGQSFVYPDKFRNYFCSVCGFELDTHIRQEPNYCPNCGADMREVEE